MKVTHKVVCSLSIVLLLSSAALAQLSKGSLSGTITDPNNLVIAGAKVLATHVPTGIVYETVTSDAGLYAFPSLNVGPYTVSVEQAGFKKLTRSGVVIAISTRSVLDLKMEIGEVSQSIEVTGAPPVLQTATSEVGSSFAPKLFTDAPIFAGGLRNPETFVAYQAGVVNGGGAEGGISGGARRAKEILIDGANATNPESGGVAFNGLPTIEQLGEFKVINNTFAAEYGRTGGGIESFVTASGGSQFHGSVFDFHTSSALSANSWANNASRVRKPSYHGNEYGFVVGGPLWVPKVYNASRDKTFFLFSYNGYRRSDSSSSFLTVPTQRQREGCFDEPGLRPIFDRTTETQFPGNCIPQDRLSSVSRNILPLIPLPTTGGLQNNYLATRATKSDFDSWSIKIDHRINDRHLISGWYNTQDLSSLVQGPMPGPLFGSNSNAVTANRPQFARFNYDWIIAPNKSLHVTYGITRLRQYFDNPSVGQGWPQKLGLKGVSEGDTNAFPVITFADGRYQNYADTNGPKTKGTQFNFTDHVRGDLSWVKGKFNWKFGADHRWMRTTGIKLSTGGFDDAGVQGVFQFSPLQTASRNAQSTTGDSFASFLLGAVNTASRTFNASASSANFGYHGWYAQTDWKVRPNLTLNLGLRYEIPVPRSTSPTSFTSFDPNLTNPTSGLKGALAYLGDCSGCINSNRFGKIDYSSVGPRLGMAWSVNEKTVVRVGYGIHYSAGNGLTGGFCLRCQTGYSTTAGLSAPEPFSAALRWDNGFVPSATFVAPPVISAAAGNAADDIWYISPDSGTAPRFKNWALTIQRELPWKLVAEASYIGNRGTRLSASHRALNQLDPKFYSLGALLNRRIDDPQVVAAGFTSPYPTFIQDWGNGATLARALRPYPHINGPINNHYNPIGSSWYDSMQLKLDRRFSSVTMELNYTWSKALTNASGSQTSGDAANRNPKAVNTQDPRALEVEKSLQYIDIPHIFNVVATWDLPFGKGKRWAASSIADRFLGGWTVSFAGQYANGALILLNAPLTYPNWGFEYGRKKVNLTGQPIRTGVARKDLDPRNSSIRWLSPGFYSVPGQFDLGTAPNYLNQLREPNIYTDNMGFIKRTRITETVNFEIRGEFFNVFNRTNFGFGGIPVRPNVLDLTRFGVPNGPRTGARLGQIVAKINF
ncbi:MAG: carboxypeptidase regulatory-like domain-containing protein [Acidobacteriota bacterium]